MLYAKLVARISEDTRTSKVRGSGGSFDQNSTIFRVPESVELDGLGELKWLKIPEGDAQGTYPVMDVVGHDVLLDRPFMSCGEDVRWELLSDGVSEEDVRKVLYHFPDVIMECEEGEQVKTYLGVIKMVRRKRKRVKDPQGRWTFSPERLQARLRPGKRLQKLLEDGPSGPTDPGPPGPEDGPERP
jgi:hypothetical protein